MEQKATSLALEYLTPCVLRLIQDPNNMNEIWDLVNTQILARTHLEPDVVSTTTTTTILPQQRAHQFTSEYRIAMYVLFKCLNSFPTETADTFNTFVDDLLEVVETKTSSMEKFANDFAKDRDAQKFKECVHIRRMFEIRKQMLREKVRSRPEFSWSMPHVHFGKCAQMVEFLRSELPRKEFEFKSPRDLSIFVENFTQLKLNCENELSATVERTSDKSVVVAKTRELYERKLGQHIDHLVELNSILEFLNS